MCRLESFIILPMTSLHFPVMSGGKRPDHFVLYTVLFQMYLKESGLVPMGSEAVGKLGSVIGLNTFDRHRKVFYQVIQKLRR